MLNPKIEKKKCGLIQFRNVEVLNSRSYIDNIWYVNYIYKVNTSASRMNLETIFARSRIRETFKMEAAHQMETWLKRWMSLRTFGDRNFCPGLFQFWLRSSEG
jgi:hypothetical protein